MMLLLLWNSGEARYVAPMLPIAGLAAAYTLEFFFSSRRRHTSLTCDWSSDVSLPISDDVEALRARVAELEAAEADRARATKVQSALYRIAETASAAQDMQEFYATIHGIVGELMYAENFYIVLYDEERQLMNWPFYVDEVDPGPPEPSVWTPIGTGQSRGVTGYLLRTGQPMLLSTADVEQMGSSGEIEMLGAES